MTEYAPLTTEKFLKYSKEKLSQKRKIASEKMGRFVSGVLFNRDIQNFASYTGVDLDDDTLDLMREQRYQEGRDKREYYKDKSTYYARRMGAYAMMVPGVGIGVDRTKAFGKDFMWERRRSKAKKTGYKREHGTFVSKTAKHWETSQIKLTKLNETKAQLAERKEQLI